MRKLEQSASKAISGKKKRQKKKRKRQFHDGESNSDRLRDRQAY
jgi:hypothetical protein